MSTEVTGPPCSCELSVRTEGQAVVPPGRRLERVAGSAHDPLQAVAFRDGAAKCSSEGRPPRRDDEHHARRAVQRGDRRESLAGRLARHGDFRFSQERMREAMRRNSRRGTEDGYAGELLRAGRGSLRPLRTRAAASHDESCHACERHQPPPHGSRTVRRRQHKPKPARPTSIEQDHHRLVFVNVPRRCGRARAPYPSR
jgi:hypothetical protein